MAHPRESYEMDLERGDNEPLQPPQLPQRHSLSRRIFSHQSFSWAALICAIILFALTVMYAWHPVIFSQYELVGSTPGRALALLAIFSQIGGICLAGTLAHAFAVLFEARLARAGGIRFLELLALHPGTGIEGSIEIMLRGPWYLLPKLWSTLRICAVVMNPILSIVLMSNVTTQLIFTPLPTPHPARGYGITEFNHSNAILLQPMTDAFFSTRFKDFTSDSDLSLDVTADRSGCENAVESNKRCRNTLFVPGGIENSAPTLLNTSLFANSGSIQPVLALNQTSSYFDFEDPDSLGSYAETECITAGYGIGAIKLCLKNTASNVIQAFLTTCPKDLGSRFQCMTNSTWPSSKGWTTSLSYSTRKANIGYNGRNGTILYHEFLGDPQNVTINASDLLSVFNVTFTQRIDNTTKWGNLLYKLGIGSNRPIAPLIVWQYFEGIAGLSASNPGSSRRAITGLQSLLALAMYHCQNKDFAEMKRVLLAQLDNDTDLGRELGPQIVESFPTAEPDTDIVPAVIRYNLNVGRATLIAYILLSGASLAACLVAQIMASFTGLGKKQNMGTFPMIDRERKWEIRYGNNRPVATELLQAPVAPAILQVIPDEKVLTDTSDFWYRIVGQQALPSEVQSDTTGEV